jgi:hypothetical protein
MELPATELPAIERDQFPGRLGHPLREVGKSSAERAGFRRSTVRPTCKSLREPDARPARRPAAEGCVASCHLEDHHDSAAQRSLDVDLSLAFLALAADVSSSLRNSCPPGRSQPTLASGLRLSVRLVVQSNCKQHAGLSATATVCANRHADKVLREIGRSIAPSECVRGSLHVCAKAQIAIFIYGVCQAPSWDGDGREN